LVKLTIGKFILLSAIFELKLANWS
jgi:hypothetical protein